MGKAWRGLCICAAFLMGPSVGTAQTIGASTTLTPADMAATALTSLQSGQAARALALSEALLIRNPADTFALETAARAALEIEQSDVAFERARTLYRTTKDAQTRFVAARIAALAAAHDDRLTTSQLWLRRARQAAPNAQQARAVADDFRTVRAQNPLSVTLDFGITPTSNINNGTSEETFDVVLFGVPFTLPFSPSQQELSGHAISGGANLTYRVHGTDSSLTRLSAGLSGDFHVLSSESKALAPTFDASSLNEARVSGGIEHLWAAGPAGTPASVSLSYGATFLDGEVYARDLNLTATRQWSMADTSFVTGAVTLGRTEYVTTDQAATLWAANLAWQIPLETGQVVTLSGEGGQSLSDAARYGNQFKSLGAGIDFGTLADRFDVALNVDYRWRTYDTDGAVARADETGRVKLSVGLPQIEYYGFVPVIGVEASQTHSNAARFNTRSLSMDIGLRSSF